MTRSVTFSSPFATYECDAATNALPGDIVAVSGFGKKANNGEFLMLYRSENLITVYNPSAAAQTKTAFSGDRESSKTVDIFVLT